MDLYKKSEFAEKEKRLFFLIDKHNAEAVVISRRDNFTWLTGGGTSHVVLNSEFGVGYVIITKDKKYVVANSMDAQRLYDEELFFDDFELVSLKWFEESPIDKLLEIIGERKFICDTDLPHGEMVLGDIYEIHYPLTKWEIARYKKIAKDAEQIIFDVAQNIKPGMTEKQVKSMLMQEYAKQDMAASVVILGSDERIAKYRHCIPTDKKIDKIVMLAPAIQKYGLTVPITRFVYFGDEVPKVTQNKFDTICKIEALTFAMCKKGRKFTEIFEKQKELYLTSDYKDEWKEHFQGGITGYLINDPTNCVNSDRAMTDNMTFNWYITISGTKVEETILISGDDKEIITSNGIWPTKTYEYDGQKFELPQIMIKK